jgi:hypothetical protein
MLLICMILIFFGCTIPIGIKIYQINKIHTSTNHNYAQELQDKKEIRRKFKEITWLTLTMILLAVLLNFGHYLMTLY